MAEANNNKQLLEMTAQIVAAHVANNPVPREELAKLLRDVHGALEATARGAAAQEPPAPAVPVKRSVRPNAIACLECGKAMKMLKRHLWTDHGLTPVAYRGRWRLAVDYPMVAPNYARQRSDLTKRIGLGRKRRRQKGKKG